MSFSCQLCQSAEDVYTLPVCEHSLCRACIANMHAKSLNTCPFDRKQVDYAAALSQLAARSKVSYCDTHPDTKLEFYCKRCKVPICYNCILRSSGIHKEHEFCDLQEEVDHTLSRLQNFVGVAKRKTQQMCELAAGHEKATRDALEKFKTSISTMYDFCNSGHANVGFYQSTFVDSFVNHSASIQKAALQLCTEAKRIQDTTKEIVNQLKEGEQSLQTVPDLSPFALPPVLFSTPVLEIVPTSIFPSDIDIAKIKIPDIKITPILHVPTSRTALMIAEREKIKRRAQNEGKIHSPPTLPGALYVLGGVQGDSTLSSIKMYDINTKKWTVLESKLNPIREYFGAIELDKKIIVLGGKVNGKPSRTMQILDPTSNLTSKSATSIPDPTSNLSTIVVSGKIYITGGRVKDSVSNKAFFFDPESGHWNPANNMLFKREDHSIAKLHDQLYVAGGFDGASYLASMERYDVRVGTWHQLSPMNRKIGCSAVISNHNHIYMCGGKNSEGPLSVVERFDIRNQQWEPLANMRMKKFGACAALVDNELFVIGGINDALNFHIKTVETYNANNDIWSIAEEKVPGDGFGFAPVVHVL